MVHTLNEEQLSLSLKSKKFIIWLFVVSSSIMFGGWTSYYIVFSASKGKGHGLVLPEIFMYSTAVLLVSSVCLFLANRALKKNQITQNRLLVWLTMVLGVVFGVMQFMGWQSLVGSGAMLVNNNASISMIYIISGFHLLHILAGIGVLGAYLYSSYANFVPARINFRMQIAGIFWHFIDILWIYLYVFLLLNS